MSPVKFPFYARLALTLLAVVLTLFLLKIGADIFIPLFFSLLIAILLFPLNRFFETKLHLGRTVSAFMSVFAFVAALGVFIYFLSLQIIRFADDFPQLRMRFQDILDNLQHWLSYKMRINNRQQTDYINRSVDGFLGSLGHSVSNIFLSVAGILLMFVFVIIFTFFILYHRRLLMRFALHLFSVQYRPKVTEVIVETKSLMYGYILGLMIEMVVICVLASVMFLVMGIKYSLLLGIMAGVLNIIPYLGIYSSMVIVMLVTLANSTGNEALIAGAGLLAIHVLDSNILMPRIVGGRAKMNPFITIIAVIIGEMLWGIPGMFLFIPVTGVIKLVCDRVDGLEAWGILIGVDGTDKQKIKIPKRPANKE